jgi:hypothetical protein
MRKWARDFMLGTATNATRPAAVRSKVTNGRKMIADLDGRSGPARRWRDLVISYADDFGGLANLTEVQRTLISQAATLAVEGEKLSAAMLKGKSADSEALTRLANPMLARLVRNRTADSLELESGVAIEIRAASFRSVRGITCVAAVCDEICFWYSADSGSANPDSFILDAIRPSLATTHGPLIAISSPYSRRGEAFETLRRHFGEKGDKLILVAQGASRDFNPNLPQRVVDRAMERDPAAASAEYLGAWRSDLQAFVSLEAVEACVEAGVYERPLLSSLAYVAFTDPSGGSADSFTLAIAHRERDGRVTLDCVRERQPPFSPEAVVADFAATLKAYRCATVFGDKYAGQFPRELFQKRGVMYRLAERSKSDLYVELLPLINSRRVELLDDRKAIAQLVGLERRTSRVGKDSIDHAPGGHDDRINAIAGAVVTAAARAPLSISPRVLEMAGRHAAGRALALTAGRFG